MRQALIEIEKAKLKNTGKNNPAVTIGSRTKAGKRPDKTKSKLEIEYVTKK